MTEMRSTKTMSGRVFTGARALYRAAGASGDDMGKKLIIAIANSFNKSPPDHVHLNEVDHIASEVIKEAGGILREFNTMAADDGTVTGYTGMLYSLPPCDITADTIEYQCNVHCADVLICISNYDKVVSGVLVAALRPSIPTMFVSGDPTEAGTMVFVDGTVKSTDLIDVMYVIVDDSVSDRKLSNYKKTVCPTCGLCTDISTANSMNRPTEAIGLALPSNGTILASHSYRKDLFERAAKQVVKIVHQYYDDSDDSVLSCSITTKEASESVMTMDVAVDGSTNTVLHILVMAQPTGANFTLDNVECISYAMPCTCKTLPSGKWEIPDVHRAGGITDILGEPDRAGKLHTNVHSINYPALEIKLTDRDVTRPTCTEEAQQMYKATSGHIISPESWAHTALFDSLDRDRANGAVHDINHPEIHEGGLTVLRGNLAPDGYVVKTASVPPEIWKLRGSALVVNSQGQTIEVILNDTLEPGMTFAVRYEGPKGGPGMQEMLCPTSFVKGKGTGKQVAILTNGCYSDGSPGLAIGHMAPEAANKGPVALIKNGDIISINIEARSVSVELTNEQLDERRREFEAGDGHVIHRDRHVFQTLKACVAFTRLTDKGVTRGPGLINKLSGLD